MHSADIGFWCTHNAQQTVETGWISDRQLLGKILAITDARFGASTVAIVKQFSILSHLCEECLARLHQ